MWSTRAPDLQFSAVGMTEFYIIFSCSQWPVIVENPSAWHDFQPLRTNCAYSGCFVHKQENFLCNLDRVVHLRAPTTHRSSNKAQCPCNVKAFNANVRLKANLNICMDRQIANVGLNEELTIVLFYLLPKSSRCE